MINEYKAFLDAFNQGKMIKSAAKVKNYAVLGNSIGLLFVSISIILRGMGYGIPISDQDLINAGSGVGSLYLLVNGIIHIVTSKKIGFKSNN